MSTAFQENSHSFIVRVWLENRELSGVAPEWRAVVEHVPSGERRYLRQLDEILPFIVSHLGDTGVIRESTCGDQRRST